MNISVLGAGAWGCALGRLLCLAGHRVTLWSHLPSQLEEIRTTGSNALCLPGIELPRDWYLEADLRQAMIQAEVVVMAVPSRPFREVSRVLGDFRGLVVSVTKGIEYETGLTMSGILAETASWARVAALSGPSLAMEVARDIPTAIVAASKDLPVAGEVQRLFHRPTFRVYTSQDVLGVELGGALKNVIAIGAGVCDGLGFGDNSKSALITRAIVEVRRLGIACGARGETFAGLSGLGDLTVTCFSRLSRNRGLGERLGRGERLEDILRSMTAVAEGVPTARSAFQLARRHQIDTPIIDEVYAMLYEQKPVAIAVRDLISRDQKAE